MPRPQDDGVPFVLHERHYQAKNRSLGIALHQRQDRAQYKCRKKLQKAIDNAESERPEYTPGSPREMDVGE